jgi:hypothetical protein
VNIARVVIVAVLLQVLPSHARSGRIVVAEGGKHRILVVDRESGAIVNEKSDFGRVDCLAVLTADDLIVCDASQFVRLGIDLTERRRTPVGFERVGSVTPLGSDQLLVSDTERHAVVSIDGLGNELSSIPVHYPSNVVRLSNGRLLVADGTPTLKTFERDGTLVSQLGLTRWAASLDVAASGDILVGESLGYERFDASHRRVWFRPSKSRVSCIQHLASDEVLLCEPDAHRVGIVDADGVLVWEFPNLDYPWRAVYLP